MKPKSLYGPVNVLIAAVTLTPLLVVGLFLRTDSAPRETGAVAYPPAWPPGWMWVAATSSGP